MLYLITYGMFAHVTRLDVFSPKYRGRMGLVVLAVLKFNEASTCNDVETTALTNKHQAFYFRIDRQIDVCILRALDIAGS